MKVKPWFFLTISILIVAGALAVSAATQARQDELRELQIESDQQLQQLREARQQLEEAVDRLDELEDMLLNLRRMESIVTGQAAPSRGGRITLATMPLDTPSGYSAARFERVFAGTALAGIGEALVEAELVTGINALVLAAICAHESGWGTSRLAREKNNLAGLGAYDGCEYTAALAFESRAECVMYLARLLRDKPGTLTDVGRWYAADPGWSEKVAGCMSAIFKKAGKSKCNFP